MPIRSKRSAVLDAIAHNTHGHAQGHDGMCGTMMLDQDMLHMDNRHSHHKHHHQQHHLGRPNDGKLRATGSTEDADEYYDVDEEEE